MGRLALLTWTLCSLDFCQEHLAHCKQVRALPDVTLALTEPTQCLLTHTLPASCRRISYLAGLAWCGRHGNYTLLVVCEFCTRHKTCRDVWVCTAHMSEGDGRDNLFFEPDHVH